ncbi:hypothetical protein HYFRA_00009502 [Hymenoscyphus fraxineus]|uniref:Uncharacterized protein n=1 Tax=Hymenoscyphus fraxineus TaxID=746836 RepID=A0A9N9KZE6_9HELO|nr:hypothetical protein HYFRA_00009502 [Hymenoscyphus fraxineus]
MLSGPANEQTADKGTNVELKDLLKGTSTTPEESSKDEPDGLAKVAITTMAESETLHTGADGSFTMIEASISTAEFAAAKDAQQELDRIMTSGANFWYGTVARFALVSNKYAHPGLSFRLPADGRGRTTIPPPQKPLFLGDLQFVPAA